MVALHRLGNVEICPYVLGDRPSMATLSTPLKRSGSMGFGLAHIGAEALTSVAQDVRLATLDAFAAERALARLDFIKADI